MKRLVEEDEQPTLMVDKKVKVADQPLNGGGAHQPSDEEKKLSEMIRYKKKLSSVSAASSSLFE